MQLQRQISERDWKVLRELEKVALDRFCERTIGEITAVIAKRPGGNHQTFLAVWNLLNERNEELAEAFDDLSRSRAWFKIANMRHLALFTDEEFARFSAETQGAVAIFLGQ